MSEAAYSIDYDPHPIHSQRIGFTIRDGGLFYWGPSTSSTLSWGHRLRRHHMSWPLGKLTLYQDHLTIKGFPTDYVLGYEDIIQVSRFLFFNVRIEHRSAEVPRMVIMWGWRLAGAIAEAASRTGVQLRCRL
jgi:hypothetical protein